MDEIGFLETHLEQKPQLLKLDDMTVVLHKVGFIIVTTSFSFDLGWDDEKEEIPDACV